MAKVKKVKWAVGGDEPADLAEFKDNEQIVKEMKGLPTKGVYSLKVKRMYVKPNKNDDDRVGVMLIMHDDSKKGKAAGYNGYLVRDGFNITEQGTPFLKRFLKGLGLTWNDFYNKSKEAEDNDRRELVQIGGVKFGSQASEDPIIRALLKVHPPDDYNDTEYMDVVRYIPSDDAEDEDASGDEEPAADMGSEEGEALSQAALEAMKPKELRTLAGENGIKAKKIDKAGKDKDALVALITKELNVPPF